MPRSAVATPVQAGEKPAPGHFQILSIHTADKQNAPADPATIVVKLRVWLTGEYAEDFEVECALDTARLECELAAFVLQMRKLHNLNLILKGRTFAASEAP